MTLRTFIRVTILVICCLGLLMATSPGLAKDNHSGFLDDYKKLDKEKDPLGVKRLVWIGPQLNGENYSKYLVDPVIYFPVVEGTEQVTAEVLEEIRQYLEKTLKESLGAEVTVVGEPGEGVARVSVAITAASISKKLKAHEYIPIAMLAAGAKEAAGVRKRDVDLAVEAEITDSLSGDVLAMAVREAKGIKLQGKDDQLTLEDAKPQIDEWGDAMGQILVKLIQE